MGRPQASKRNKQLGVLFANTVTASSSRREALAAEKRVVAKRRFPGTVRPKNHAPSSRLSLQSFVQSSVDSWDSTGDERASVSSLSLFIPPHTRQRDTAASPATLMTRSCKLSSSKSNTRHWRVGSDEGDEVAGVGNGVGRTRLSSWRAANHQTIKHCCEMGLRVVCSQVSRRGVGETLLRAAC
eukprot:1576096-Rhodomonas_salina.1